MKKHVESIIGSPCNEHWRADIHHIHAPQQRKARALMLAASKNSKTGVAGDFFWKPRCPPAVGMIQGHSSPNVKVTRMMYNNQLVDFLRDGMYEEQIQSYVNGSALVVNQICIWESFLQTPDESTSQPCRSFLIWMLRSILWLYDPIFSAAQSLSRTHSVTRAFPNLALDYSLEV